jgi:hypothetical protein
VTLQPSHRSKARLERPVVGLERIVRMGLRAAEGRRERLIEDARARPVPAVVTSWVRPEGASLRAGGAGSYERGALWAKADILRWAKGYRGGAKHRVTQPYAGRGCRARNLGSRPRSFFEFARPAPPRQPRWGSQTVHRARHLFGEHCLATPAPMSYLSRSQEGSITHQGTDSGFGPANGARG